MIVASDNFLHAKIINIRANFTRMFRQEGESISLKEWNDLPAEVAKKNVMYGKMIKQDDWVAKKSFMGSSDPSDNIK